MKLVQLNTWSCKLPTEIIRFFKEEQPDITTLQEVVAGESGGKIFDTINDITAQYPFENTVHAPLVEFNFMDRTASRGNMIATNFPVVDSTEVWTHGEGVREGFDYIDDHGYNVARNIVHAIVATPEGPVNILTLHGYHVGSHKNGNNETMHACRVLVDYALQLDGPIIITGDFNLAPDSESLQIVNNSFRNLSIESGLTTTRNHLTTKTEVCDYIFVNDLVKVDTFRVSDIIASDHAGLVLEFRL